MSDLVITFDVDWAPDFVIEEIADLLERKEVRSTWFVTHPSPALERLRERPDLFELGVHPDFAAASSHGATPAEAMAHLREIVPGARSTRSHRLALSSEILGAIAADPTVEIDVSLFLPGHAHLRPVRQWLGRDSLVRIPYLWADDHEQHVPEPDWSLAPICESPGLKVLDFHPMLVHLNAADPAPYSAVKEAGADLRAVTPDQTRDYVNRGAGSRTALEAAIERIASAGTSKRIVDVAVGA